MPVQMVTIMDQGGIPLDVVTNSYEALYKLVAKALYRTHVEGKLKVRALLHKASATCSTYAELTAGPHRKVWQSATGLMLQAEITQDPSRYVELDPDMAATLIDLRQAVGPDGARLLAGSMLLTWA